MYLAGVARVPEVVRLYINTGYFSTTGRQVTSTTKGPPPLCNQALNHLKNLQANHLKPSKTTSVQPSKPTSAQPTKTTLLQPSKNHLSTNT